MVYRMMGNKAGMVDKDRLRTDMGVGGKGPI